MKTFQIASICALVAMTAFACSDDDDDAPSGSAGKGGSSAGSTNGGNKNGGSANGGSANAGSANGGTKNGGSANGGSAGSVVNTAGASDGGVGGQSAGEGGAGGYADGWGGASEGGAGGEGGASDVGAGGEGPALGVGFELIGTYTSNFGGEDVITRRRFNGALIVEYDNAANVVYTQNPPNAQYSPNKFNKIVYTEPAGGSFYYCTIAYGKDTLAAAKADATVADSSEPDTKGCGGFSWNKATAQ